MVITTSKDETKLACVQTSPLPQKKSGEETLLPIFSEGGGTSVHRLNLKNDTNKSIQAMLSYTGYFWRWHENHSGLSSCPRIRTVISARFSVRELSCDAPICKVESHVLDRCLLFVFA